MFNIGVKKIASEKQNDYWCLKVNYNFVETIMTVFEVFLVYRRFSQTKIFRFKKIKNSLR